MYILSQDKTRIYNMSGHIEGIGYEESKDYKQRKSENIRHAKDFLIEFEGDRYDIYATDFKQNDRQYVQLKANRHD